MRKAHYMLTALGFLLALISQASAQEGPPAIIDKAIKAYGGEDKLAKVKGAHVKSKGTIEIGGMTLPFTEESTTEISGKIKEAMQLDIMNMKINVTTVFNGTKGWINANGMKQEMSEMILAAMQDAKHLMKVSRLIALKEKEFQLAPLGEIKVNGKSAVGIKVSAKGQKDVNLYFDKDTGLLIKVEHRTLDPMSGQEVSEERLFSDFRDMDGIKVPTKAVVNRDGKKFMELEVIDGKFLDKVDDSEFAEP